MGIRFLRNNNFYLVVMLHILSKFIFLLIHKT